MNGQLPVQAASFHVMKLVAWTHFSLWLFLTFSSLFQIYIYACFPTFFSLFLLQFLTSWLPLPSHNWSSTLGQFWQIETCLFHPLFLYFLTIKLSFILLFLYFLTIKLSFILLFILILTIKLSIIPLLFLFILTRSNFQSFLFFSLHSNCQTIYHSSSLSLLSYSQTF